MSVQSEAPVNPAIDPDIIPPETRVLVGDPVEESPDELPDDVTDVVTLTEDERRDFQMLMTCGRRIKTITVMGDHKVKIQTLKSGDEMRIGLYTKPHLGSQGFARAYQVAMCAAAIIEVDGVPLYASIRKDEEVSPEAAFAKRVEAVEQYYPIVISQIYDQITALEREFAELADKLGKLPG